MINYLNISDLKPFEQGLNALKLFTDKSLEIIHITMNEGESIAEHTNSVDVLFYVVSGKAKLTVNKEHTLLEEGSFVEIKKDLIRSWENIAPNSTCLLAIKRVGQN